jgi:oligopeptide transport system substrate-binding protein
MRNETYPQMLNGEGWCADYPDQQDWLSVYWHSRSEFSRKLGYKNEQVDKLMDQADIEIYSNTRALLYDKAQKLIIGDVPVIIWGNTRNNYLIKPYVKGLDFTPQDAVFPGQQTCLLNVTLDM